MMSQFPIPAARTSSLAKVLLLENDLGSAHTAREGIRRAGLTVILETVGTREEFLSRLHAGPVDLILAETTGLPGLTVAEVLEYARDGKGRVPLVLIEKDDQEQGVLQVRDDVSDYGRLTQLGRLPAFIERALEDQRDHETKSTVELDRAADVLRENQKLLTLGRLSASIAHEINNPLESVMNLLYLMEIDSPEKTAEYLKMAQRELNRVVQISKQTLTFSRETDVPVRLQLAELVEEVLTLYARRTADKDLRIIRQYESSQTLTVFPGEMRQVLSNLIANAIEASALDGQIMIRIRHAHKWSDPGVRGLRLSVADNGSGISPEVRKRLGEAFFTTKGHAGTGLGLWVTRSILSRYGGSLQVRSSISEERHGTVFSVFLPTNMRPLAVVSGGTSGSAVSSGNPASGPRLRSTDINLIDEGRLRASGD